MLVDSTMIQVGTCSHTSVHQPGGPLRVGCDLEIHTLPIILGILTHTVLTYEVRLVRQSAKLAFTFVVSCPV